MNIKVKKILLNPLVVAIILSVLLNLIIEAAGRRSLVLCLQYIGGSPMTFLYNAFLILITFTPVYFVRRRFFVYVVVSVLWLAIGIMNGILLGFRITPFTVSDFLLLEDGLAILPNYLKTGELILVVAGAVVFITALVVLFIFAPKYKGRIDYKKSLAGLLLTVALVFAMAPLALRVGWVSDSFANLNYAYRDYGVPYCFINTWVNKGIDEPKQYSREKILGIFAEDELSDRDCGAATAEPTPQGGPNIIFLQLESFFDPQLMLDYQYSTDPAPNFRKLKENYSSGFLTVPIVGAGTANTEFEVMTGMSVRFFGPGEYPYKSVLKKKTVESVCYDLKRLGYATHAIHNHRGSFYGRNAVFANLGYDTFTSVEYMNNILKTPNRFEKDGVLTDEIFSALTATEEQDLIYTISVQGHGEFPTEKVYDEPAVTVAGIDNEAEYNKFEYYLQQVYEMDQFVGELVRRLQSFKEDTLLVLYGDHLPYLNIQPEELANGDIYQTEYVIWSNFDLAKEDQDLCSYQLSAEVLRQAGISEGVLTKYHQNHMADADYWANLGALQYDMLYGKQYIYDGSNPFPPTELRMGVRKIKIERVLRANKKYYVIGENFTPYSRIYLNGKVENTIFVSPTTLELKDRNIKIEDITKVQVCQIEKKNKSVLSVTE
ncbi:MAG: LTA synthase family protein [Clostridia bacterium]|nr:LTA synthase family protein [Clostridia bacterium]